MRLAVLALEGMLLLVFLPVIATAATTTIVDTKRRKQIRQHPSFECHATRAQNRNKEEMKQNETSGKKNVEEVETGNVDELGIVGREGAEGGEVRVEVEVGIMRIEDGDVLLRWVHLLLLLLVEFRIVVMHCFGRLVELLHHLGPRHDRR